MLCTEIGRFLAPSPRVIPRPILLRYNHPLTRSLAPLTRLLRTARLARALRCAHSLAHSLAPELMRKEDYVYELNASISFSFNPLCIVAMVEPSSGLFHHDGDEC